MSSKDPAAPGFKQKAAREFKEVLWISGYLAFFFCALATYTMLLLRKYDLDSYLTYSFAIINALVIGKVILIAQMAHLGRSYEKKPLYQAIFYKAILFGLVGVCRVSSGGGVCETRDSREAVWECVEHETRWEDMVARTVVVFCAFIPLFGFIELRRVLGEEKLYSLLRSRGGVEADLSSH